MALREAWFLNGCLFNSEVWGNYTKADINKLEVIDHMILKSILGSQDKVPIEFLYLETATLDIPSVISVRRMGYLHTILNRHDGELIKKIYTEMKKNPFKGDWYKLLENDYNKINEDINEENIIKMSKSVYKSQIKTKLDKLLSKNLVINRRNI